ncbi:hypothetical protein ABKV19_000954, partial [Rosa sericea]
MEDLATVRDPEDDSDVQIECKDVYKSFGEKQILRSQRFIGVVNRVLIIGICISFAALVIDIMWKVLETTRVLIRAHISGGLSSLEYSYIIMAKRSQGPKFLHQLRTSALPPNHLRTSAEKVSGLVKPLDKPTTPACPLRSSTEKVSKVIKPLVKPTALSSPLRLSPRKHSKTQPSTNRSTHPRRPAIQSSRTPSPPSSPYVMRSSPLSPSPPHVRTVLSSSNQHTSTPSAHEEIAESSQVAHPPTLEENIG